MVGWDSSGAEFIDVTAVIDMDCARLIRDESYYRLLWEHGKLLQNKLLGCLRTIQLIVDPRAIGLLPAEQSQAVQPNLKEE